MCIKVQVLIHINSLWAELFHLPLNDKASPAESHFFLEQAYLGEGGEERLLKWTQKGTQEDTESVLFVLILFL